MTGDDTSQKASAKGQRVRVDFRRNRSSKARQNQWTRRVRLEGQEDMDSPTSERVAPKGDLSRKRTVFVTEESKCRADLRRGTVVAMSGRIANVDTGDGVWPCTIRRILRTRLIEHRHPVVVGDEVDITLSNQGETSTPEGVVESVQPRRSELGRRSGKRIHALVANVDQALIVGSARMPDFKPHLIDRYIVAALAGSIRPVVCINKIDLDPKRTCVELLERYRTLGYPTVASSVTTGEGLDDLRVALAGKSSVVAGQSGVGKSSLLNALQPGLGLTVGDVIEHTTKGRHTTTTATLIRLSFGGYVVDTPGTKSFDCSTVPREELEMYFEELIPLVPDCKFADCTHTHEIGCAVRQAAEDGRIHPDRYASYIRLFEEFAT